MHHVKFWCAAFLGSLGAFWGFQALSLREKTAHPLVTAIHQPVPVQRHPAESQPAFASYPSLPPAPTEVRGLCYGVLLHYILRWRAKGDGNGGDLLEIFPSPTTDVHSNTRSSVKPVYQFQEDTGWYILGVARWEPPDWNEDFPSGVLVTLGYATGSSREYVIIALGKDGRFHQALYAISDHTLALEPENIDLDRDAYPELIIVPEYEYIYGVHAGLDLAHTRAQVWKWSPSRFRYVMVRESWYVDRLKPLHLSHFH